MALIEINLLPAEKQKKKKKSISMPEVKSFLPWAISLIILVVVVHIFLSLVIFWNKALYNNLSGKWNSLEQKNKEAELLKNEVSRMEKKISLVEQLIAGRFSWTKKLQSLNESIIPGVWLNSFILGEKVDPKDSNKKSFLSLSGNAVTSGGQGAATIGKFMKSLKENPEFFNDFEEIELGTIQRKNIKDTEIMDFTINAYFKKGKLSL